MQMRVPQRVLLSGLLITSFGANAVYDPSNPCNLPIPPPPIVFTDFLDRGIIDCVPWPFQGITDSNSTNWDFYRTPTGFVAAWYCKGTNGAWGYNIASVTNDEVTSKPGYFSSLATDLVAAQVANPASSPAQVLSTVAKTRVNTPMNSEIEAAVWCPAWAQIWAKWPEPKNIPVVPPPPPPTNLVVAPTTYFLKSGVLTSLLSKAVVGAKCNCAAPYNSNGKKYCTFAGAIATIVLAECS